MSTVSFSSNPLTTLMPLTSAYLLPNFNNAFNFTPNGFNSVLDIALNTLLNDLSKPLGNMLPISFLDLNTQNINNRIAELSKRPSSVIPKTPKPNLMLRFLLSTFGKNTLAWSDAMNTLNTGIDTIFGLKKEYDGDKGHTTAFLDNTYDSILNAAGNFGSIGKFVQFGMEANKLLGNVANKLGAGTSGMTTTDAILGSSFMLLTPLGLINGFGGKRADTITKNNEIFEQAGASYTGTNATVDDALTKSGKKYGLFSGGSRAVANRLIAEAKRLLLVMTDIVDNATNRFSLRNSMAAINGNRYGFAMQGGYDLSLMRAGKHGLKVSPIIARRVVKKYLKGNKVVDPFEYYLSTLPDNLKDSTNFRVKDYWIFNGKPKDFNEALTKKMFSKKKDGYHANTVSENPETGEIEYMKSSTHPTRYMESDWYEKGLIYNDDGTVIQLKPGVEGYDNWKDFTSNYELVKSEPYWKYVRRKTPKYLQGASIVSESFIELLDPNSVPEFKEGGLLTTESEIVPISIEDIEEFLKGGEFNYSTTIELVNPNDIPEFLEGRQIKKKSRTLEELIKYAKELNPRFIQRLSEEPRGITFTDDNGNEAKGSHYLEWSTDDKGNAIIYPRILENGKELLFYNSDDAYNRAIENSNILIMSPEEAEIFFSEDSKYGTAYKSGWPQFFNKFLNGGSINVIPDGALHARKHNMDMEGITKKGIPVIDNDGKLLCEIEKEEIILRLELTEKLEELLKKYSHYDTSKKEKDEIALEAGKLLVLEILYNTLDNTNNLL